MSGLGGISTSPSYFFFHDKSNIHFRIQHSLYLIDHIIIGRCDARCVMIIDVTISHDENLVKTEKEQKIKHLQLAHEVVDMWNVSSAIIVPIVVTAKGLMTKGLDEHLSKLSAWIKGLMQYLLLDTARAVWRFLIPEP